MIFNNIVVVINSILSFIVPVAAGLLAIPLFKFIIYASVALGIIYFVVRLVKSFVGMKHLSIKYLNRYNGHRPTLKDGYNWYVENYKK